MSTSVMYALFRLLLDAIVTSRQDPAKLLAEVLVLLERLSYHRWPVKLPNLPY